MKVPRDFSDRGADRGERTAGRSVVAAIRAVAAIGCTTGMNRIALRRSRIAAHVARRRPGGRARMRHGSKAPGSPMLPKPASPCLAVAGDDRGRPRPPALRILTDSPAIPSDLPSQSAACRKYRGPREFPPLQVTREGASDAPISGQKVLANETGMPSGLRPLPAVRRSSFGGESACWTKLA